MQLEQSKSVTCEICSTRVPIKDMKFDLSGTSLICEPCYGRQHSRSTRHFERKELGPSQSAERRVERSSQVASYLFYQCQSCSYRFSRKASFTFLNCPHCSKQTIKVVQGNTAQQIVDGTYKDDDLGIDII